MGYSYGINPTTGRQMLACDNCGNIGGVRKRTCPHTVLTDSLRGARATLAYCQPPAYCAACFKKRGGTRTIHAECAEGAAASQRNYDATETALDAGEAFVVSAFGAWHETVPEGLVGVIFASRAGRTYVLTTEDEYDALRKSGDMRLSRLVNTEPWDYPERKTA